MIGLVHCHDDDGGGGWRYVMWYISWCSVIWCVLMHGHGGVDCWVVLRMGSYIV